MYGLTKAAWYSNIDQLMGKLVKMKSYVLYPLLILCNSLTELYAIRVNNSTCDVVSPVVLSEIPDMCE